MQASDGHSLFGSRRFHTYRTYIVGCVLAWAVLWLIVAATAPSDTRHTVLLVFLGWLIGWTSASIARLVYPPPKNRGGRGF